METQLWKWKNSAFLPIKGYYVAKLLCVLTINFQGPKQNEFFLARSKVSVGIILWFVGLSEQFVLQYKYCWKIGWGSPNFAYFSSNVQPFLKSLKIPSVPGIPGTGTCQYRLPGPWKYREKWKPWFLNNLQIPHAFYVNWLPQVWLCATFKKTCLKKRYYFPD